MPRSHPVRPIFIGRDLGPGGFELATEAYRAVTDRNRRGSRAAHPIGKVAGRSDGRLPDLILVLVKRREHLVALGIDHGEYRRSRLGARRERAQRRDAASPRPLDCARPRAVAIPIRRPVNVPGPGADRDRLDAVPAALACSTSSTAASSSRA